MRMIILSSLLSILIMEVELSWMEYDIFSAHKQTSPISHCYSLLFHVVIVNLIKGNVNDGDDALSAYTSQIPPL